MRVIKVKVDPVISGCRTLDFRSGVEELVFMIRFQGYGLAVLGFRASKSAH